MEPEQEMIDDLTRWSVWLHEHKLRWLITPMFTLALLAYFVFVIQEEAYK